jgi:group II intron reverse transcriptase/maturase
MAGVNVEEDWKRSKPMSVKQMLLPLDEPATGRHDQEQRAFIARRLAESPAGEVRLMESVCERENMRRALRQVERNKGAPGVDGMKTTQLRGYLRRHWAKIKASLLAGTYRPLPVRRKEIKKPGGGVRLLGIPTVLDRLIQQAAAQVLTELWEYTFSEHSYGSRPRRSAAMAIEQARRYVEEGYTHGVHIDLEKFYDRVNRDRLMSRLATRVTDKRMLGLVRAFLNSGVLVGGRIEEPGEGTPQGGPLSPLLANIVLDELDKELERRGLRFVRYSDDCVTYVRSQRAGNRVMGSVSRFVTRKLKLAVNEAKSGVTRPWQAKYLGFRITRIFGATRIGVHEKSLRRFRERVRTLTARDRGHSLARLIGELNEYIRGWWGYFRVGASQNLTRPLNDWLLRRLRAYRWTQWRRPRTKVRELLKAGVHPKWAHALGNTRKGPWRVSKHGTLRHALPDRYFTHSLGLVLLA